MKTSSLETVLNSSRSLSKIVISKKTFLLVLCVALVVLLLLYRNSTSGLISSRLQQFKTGLNWNQMSTNITNKGSVEINYDDYGLINQNQTQILKNIPAYLKSNLSFAANYIPSVLEMLKYKTQKVELDTISQQSVPTRVQDASKKYLIYLCDDTAWCGGWGDRQRGIVSVYLLSLAYNRTFGIRMTSPCDLAQFYQPNEISWIISERETQNKSHKVIYSIDDNPPDLNKNKQFPEDVIYIQTNMDLVNVVRKQFGSKLPKYVLNRSRFLVFRRVWKLLMKPTARLQKRMEDLIVKGTNNGSLVCAHIRIGYSKYLQNDTPRLELSSVKIVWKFMEKFKRARKHFVATDNIDVRKSARERFGLSYVDTGGTILHIDRQRHKDEACEGFETAILDQLILTHCDILVISHSNFSIRGAMLKKLLKNIFMFDGSTITAYTLQLFHHNNFNKNV